MKKSFMFLVGCVLISALGCGKAQNSKESSDPAEATSNLAESAMAEASQQTTSTEGASAPSIMGLDEDLKDMDYVDPQSVHTDSACTFASARSTCSSNISTITWSGCSVGTASLSGVWTETWSSGFCANGASPGALTTGNSVTRTSTSQTLTLASGAKIVTDTNAHTTYDSTSIPGTGITVSNSSGTRTVVIHGLHKVMTSPHGRTWFNHSITSSGLTVTGTRAGGNRVVNGTSVLFHNIANYKATHTFNSVTWGNSSCCYPTSGSITSSLTGAITGNTTLSFTNTCGVATYTYVDNSNSTISLSHCN